MAGGFNLNTRRKVIKLPEIARPVGGGSSTAVTLPKTGLLSGIYLRIGVTVAGSISAPNALGAASILRRVRLTANSGIDIYNTSGAGYQYLLRECLGTELIDPSGQSTARSAVTATTFTLDMYIPVAMQSPMRDPVGLINLQNEGTLIQLLLDWEADATVATGATVTVQTCTPYLILFTVPVDPADWPPLNMIHQILEDQQVIAAAGDSTYNWPRGNTYLQMLHGAGIGASGADNFTNVAIRLNQSDYLLTVPPTFLDLEHRLIRGRARPAGGIYFDLAATSGLGLYGSMRDLLDSARVTDLATVIAASAAGTLYTVRRQLVLLG